MNTPLVQSTYKPSPPKRVGKAGVNRPSALTQALDLRDFAAKCALDLATIEAKTLEQKVALARALRDNTSVWDTACDRARVLRNRPLPGSLKPEPKSKTKERKAWVVEPLKPE